MSDTPLLNVLHTKDPFVKIEVHILIALLHKKFHGSNSKNMKSKFCENSYFDICVRRETKRRNDDKRNASVNYNFSFVVEQDEEKSIRP